MKVLLFFVSSFFLLFNNDSIFNVLTDVVEITSSSNNKDVNFSTYQYGNDAENQNEEDLLEDAESFDEDFQNENEGAYISDNNPVTWDEDPSNYPLETPDTYENVDDEEVQSPTYYREIPQGACAICGDGTYSFSKNRRGTCSRHGGVTEWLK